MIVYLFCVRKDGDIINASYMKSSPSDVVTLLATLNDIFSDEDFDIDKSFFFIDNHKNRQTLMDLDYGYADVVAELKELQVSDYSESLLDRDNLNPPILYVFGKTIKGSEIYIKIKIREQESRRVICVSFHHAEHSMPHPYAPATSK